MQAPLAIRNTLEFIRGGGARDFEALALEVFAHQFEHNEPYRNLCLRRDRTPGNTGRWEDIPKVPASAFKHARLTTGPSLKVFRTSGTTQPQPGQHHLPDLSLYQASWEEPFGRALVPDGRLLQILSLIPSEEELPHSSLSWMAARAFERFGTEDSRVLFREGELDLNGFQKEVEDARGPLLILGTAFALAEVLDRLREAQVTLACPPGTRLMDTGGFKGRYREVTRENLLESYRGILGIPPSHVVGEYGMTELCSQFYEDPGTRLYSGPRWVRSQVLDPATLEPLAEGIPGLLSHLDLANAWTVAGVITEDMAVMRPGGIQLQGRATGAELRGCSLTVEDLLHE